VPPPPHPVLFKTPRLFPFYIFFPWDETRNPGANLVLPLTPARVLLPPLLRCLFISLISGESTFLSGLYVPRDLFLLPFSPFHVGFANLGQSSNKCLPSLFCTELYCSPFPSLNSEVKPTLQELHCYPARPPPSLAEKAA